MNEVPERLYLSQERDGDGCYVDLMWHKHPYENMENVEYIRTDAFIEKAAQFLYDYNQKQVLKHGARATLGCGEYTINVDEFRKYMKGE